MSGPVIVQYLGFEAGSLAREYVFNVREATMAPREFTLTILNEAFNSHRMRLQDAPDVCALKLHRELDATSNRPLVTHFDVTDRELEEYRASHTSKSARNKPA